MKRRWSVPCPYCGREVSILVEDDWHQKTVVTCDEDDDTPGCGKDFVADVRVQLTGSVFKIEERGIEA